MTQENKSSDSHVFVIAANSEHHVPGTVLSALYLLITLILTITL